MLEENLEAYAWSIQDEGQYEFISIKYADRKKLHADSEAKRKVADKSVTVNGAPNPHHPRLCLEADMARLRYEMAYIVCKNRELEERTEILSGLYQRVSILEGAYNFLTMGFETAKKAMSGTQKKEQPNG